MTFESVLELKELTDEYLNTESLKEHIAGERENPDFLVGRSNKIPMDERPVELKTFKDPVKLEEIRETSYKMAKENITTISAMASIDPMFDKNLTEKEIKKKKNSKKSIYHVTNAELLDALRKYRETKERKYYDLLGVLFFKIASKYTNHQKFINYDYMEKGDMIQNAVILMLSKIDNFDFDRDVDTNRSKISNPFAFYTQIATNSFKKDLGDDYKRKNLFQNVEFLENMEEGDSFDE